MKQQIASHGKRLLAGVFDFAFALLLINTLSFLQTPMHWDLDVSQQASWAKVIGTFLGIWGVICFKDSLGGRSPGKFVFGLQIRSLANLEEKPPTVQCIVRNISLLLAPIELIALLFHSYGQRLGDRWAKTVVVEDPNAMRMPFRLMAANILFFGYFFTSLLLQPWMIERTAAYEVALSFIQDNANVQQQIGIIEEVKSPEIAFDFNKTPQEATLRMQLEGSIQTQSIQMQLQRVVSSQKWMVQNLDLGN